MPAIRLKNEKYGVVELRLDRRSQTFTKGQSKDSEVATKDGVIVGPDDVLDKIEKGLLVVVNLYGLKLPEKLAKFAPAAEQPEAPALQAPASEPAPEAEKKTKKKTPAAEQPEAPAPNPLNALNIE